MQYMQQNIYIYHIYYIKYIQLYNIRNGTHIIYIIYMYIYMSYFRIMLLMSGWHAAVSVVRLLYFRIIIYNLQVVFLFLSGISQAPEGIRILCAWFMFPFQHEFYCTADSYIFTSSIFYSFYVFVNVRFFPPL